MWGKDLKKKRHQKNSKQSDSVQFSHSVVSESLQPHELQDARPPCPSITQTYCNNRKKNDQ